jgi:hypothetical protein
MASQCLSRAWCLGTACTRLSRDAGQLGPAQLRLNRPHTQRSCRVGSCQIFTTAPKRVPRIHYCRVEVPTPFITVLLTEVVGTSVAGTLVMEPLRHGMWREARGAWCTGCATAVFVALVCFVSCRHATEETTEPR